MSEPNKVIPAAGKYLTFALAGEEYGVSVLKVREIMKIMDITAVPQVPSHIRGVINLRGKVIPIVDLRLKFGLSADAPTDRTCIVVVDVLLETRHLLLGIIVDSVAEVLHVGADEIEEVPDFGERLDTTYMQGIAHIKGSVKILLDLDRVLSTDSGAAQAA